MNRVGVVMATDSVVTSRTPGGGKTYPTANKLFAVSYDHDLGIMTYGNATFIFTPWEILIKLYRKTIKEKTFKTAEECADDFVKFLENCNYFSRIEQQNWSLICFHSYHLMIIQEIRTQMQNLFPPSSKVEDEDILKSVKSIFDNIISQVEKVVENEYKQSESFLKDREIDIDNAEKEIYENLYPHFSNEIKKLTKLYFSKKSGFSSGIVISGFGEDEIKPSTVSLEIIDMREGVLIYKKKCYTTGGVYPFAQSEMVELFLLEIEPSCYSNIINIINKPCPSESKAIASEIEEHLGENLNSKNKILDSLPLPDLASAAENLVSLTSFRRRFSDQLETVGGPIDVAAISKGDGFVWIKRKHYFEPELNPHFISKYYENKSERN